MKVSVILPTYNEKDNICELIEAVAGALRPLDAALEIVVVDDNSPDGTAAAVREKYPEGGKVKLHVRTGERGLATAVRYGIEKSAGDIIAVMDTDFNHDPKLLPQMVEFLKYYDIVTGSRFTLGGGMYDNFRYYGSYLFNMMVRVVLNTRTQDNLSGFFSIRRELLFSLDFKRIFWGYGDYFFRLLFYAREIPAKIIEVPVVYQIRGGGESKTRVFEQLIKYTLALIRLRFAGGKRHW